jgi:hypothetical protein
MNYIIIFFFHFCFVQGKVKEEEVDSFNLPVYNMSPEKLEVTMDGNGCFSIE